MSEAATALRMQEVAALSHGLLQKAGPFFPQCAMLLLVAPHDDQGNGPGVHYEGNRDRATLLTMLKRVVRQMERDERQDSKKARRA